MLAVILADVTTTQVGIGGAVALIISTSITALSSRGGKTHGEIEEVLDAITKLREELVADRATMRRHNDRDNARFRAVFRDARNEAGHRIYDPWPDQTETAHET